MCSSVFEDVRRMQLNKSAQTESDVVEWLDRHEADWHEITHIEPTGDKSRLILKALDDQVVCSHLLLNLHPDGHVVDLRIYGQAQQQAEPSSPLGQAFSAMA
ncbi:MAG: hypothetical protein KVP17_003948 [Porospora cf. gigantea B]|nr:MAG: hypothetical protein KVP17_003948 [Porospora cf. gigantea B]